ncbi:MAG: hypothetical protein H7070_00810 [Saprospiraceae bacterium]|nr:hypothetical protein [Pyrinomonadaceae bacterium]
MIKNMKKKQLILLAAIIIVFTAATFSQTPKSDVKNGSSDFLGVIDGEIYQNKFFDFQIRIPSTWHVADGGTADLLREAGEQALKSNNKSQDAALERASLSEAILFTATETPIGTVPTGMVIISVQKQPGPQITAGMVMSASLKVLLASPKIELIQGSRAVKLGGRPASMVELLIGSGEGKMNQQLFVTMINGYAVSVGIAYSGNSSRIQAEKILQTLEFGGK